MHYDDHKTGHAYVRSATLIHIQGLTFKISLLYLKKQ
jgi:hypothetical protein